MRSAGRLGLGRDDPTRILLVGADRSWRDPVVAVLEAEGYLAVVDESGRLVDHPEHPFAAALVDLAFTVRPALEAIRALRATSPLPIVVVAPDQVEEAEVLEAYSAGADQCVRSSRSPRELVARIRSLLRRSPPQPCAPAVVDLTASAPIEVDVERRLAVVMGQKVDLTEREAEILAALVRRPGRVTTRSELLDGWRAVDADGALDSIVRRLRSKLEAVEGWRRIVVVRGVGFRLEPDRSDVLGRSPHRDGG